MNEIERLIEIIDNHKLLMAKIDGEELCEEACSLCLSVRFTDSSQVEEFMKTVNFVESEGYQMGIDPDECWRESLIPSLCAIYSSFAADDSMRKGFTQNLIELMPEGSLNSRDILLESEYMDSLLLQAIESDDVQMIGWLTSEWCEWFMEERWPEGIFGAAMLDALLRSNVEPQGFTIDPVQRFASTLDDSASPHLTTFIRNIFDRL